MKIYDFIGAPNPKKVRIYLVEKGLDVELCPVDITQGEQRSPEFLAKNPMGGLPVLELDDGRCFSESLAIIEYLEELHPEPPMIGTSPEERMRIRMLERICELGVLARVAQWMRHSSAFFAGRVKQNPAIASVALDQCHRQLRLIDGYIGEPFVAGERISIADCTLFATLWFAHVMKMPLELPPNVARFNADFRKRPSAKA